MSARVSALPLFYALFAEKATPTLENRRSTEAEVAGQPKYWRSQLSRPVGRTVTLRVFSLTVKKRYVIDPSVTTAAVITL